MNQDVKPLWLEALRSGEYKQGRDVLHRDSKFCCLGVLCDVYRKEHEDTQWEHTGYSSGEYEFLREKDVLPFDVMMWAGFSADDHDVYVPVIGHTLSNLNDSGKSFAEIADIIERYL